MNAGLSLKYLYCTEAGLDAHPDLEDFNPWVVEPRTMANFSALDTPSPALAIFEMPAGGLATFTAAPLVLLLDSVQDPGNVGTLIRTAAWYGCKHVACVTGTVDVYNEKVVQASMGALAGTNVHYMSAEEWAAFAKEHGHELVVGHMEGQESYQMAWPEKTVLVLGNEGNGVHPFWHQAAQHTVMIPGRPEAGVESLNVAISGATLLYEWGRTRS